MKIAIHQPEHLPWLGYFDKMASVDIYVYLDTVQFQKNGVQNRNRIPSGWVTVPVKIKGHTSKQLKDIRIANDQPWQRKYWGRLMNCYRDEPNFARYIDELEDIITAKYDCLVDINYELINFFRKYFDIHTPTITSFNLGVKGKDSQLILNICKELKADTYLSGHSGRNYLIMPDFERAGVEIQYHEYEHPPIIFSALDFIIKNDPCKF